MIPESRTLHKFFKDADFLKYAPTIATPSNNRTPDQRQMKRAATPTKPAKGPQCIDLFQLRLHVIFQEELMNRKSRPADADVVFQRLSCVAVVIAMSCAPLSATTVGGKLVRN